MGQLIYLKDVVTLMLDQEKCVGCGMCLTVCPHAVFSLNNGKARIDTRDACMECGACAMNCPTEAITVNAGVGCASAVISATLGSKSASSCCSLESGENSCDQGGCCGAAKKTSCC